MPRPKMTDTSEALTKPLIIRVNQETYERLEKMAVNSGCRNIGEVVRRILNKQNIQVRYRDTGLDDLMEELALIRKELKAIGININQQTRFFHSSKNAVERAWYADKTTKIYVPAENKVDRLLTLISKLAEKWLPKS